MRSSRPQRHGALELHERLGEAIDSLSAARSVRDGLASWPLGGGMLSHVRFWRPSARHEAQRREKAQQDLDSADRQGFASARQVERDPASLLVALRAEIVGRAGRGKVTSPRP